MKKATLITVAMIFLFFPINALSYIAYVGVDNSVDLSIIDGFQFDVAGASIDDLTLTAYPISDSETVDGVVKPGAVPNLALWDIFKVVTPTDGVSGNDVTFGSFPLTPGVILSLEGASPFTLTNFLLSDFDQGDGKYPLPFKVSENLFADGSGVEHTYNAIPIPGSILLLGSGLIGLIGIARRKMS